MKKLIAATCLSALAIPLQAKEVQPNILWIITDDHRADALECYNRVKRGENESALGYVSSPNIDKLAQEGTLFVNSMCNCPASAPSRSSMHTGRYPFRNGIFGFTPTHNTNDSAHPVIPEVMSKAGYRTSHFGKSGYYLFAYSDPMRYTNAGFYDLDVNMGKDIEHAGLGDWVSKGIYDKNLPNGKLETWRYPDGSKKEYYTSRKNAELTAEDIATKAEFFKEQQIIIPRGSSNSIVSGENTMPPNLTNDGVLTSEFCNYFDNTGKSYQTGSGRNVLGANPAQPQFIHLGFHFPHTPVMPSKEYRDRFKDLDYNVPELTDKEFRKMPEQVQKWVKRTSVGDITEAEKLQAIRDYYAFCAQGDAYIGEAVARFKKYCEDNDQPYIIVLACGDHGWHLGEQGVYTKFSNYIKSNETAVIAISSDKKLFPAGAIVEDFVEFVDFAPTFFTAAGVDVNEEQFDYLDGYDLGRVAAGKGKRDYVLGEINHVIGPRAYMRSENFAFAMRSRPTNAGVSAKNPPNNRVKWALECTPEQAEMTLFDLRVDPDEINNVAYDPKYAALADWFRTKLGNIVLGDRRMEVDWKVKNSYDISTFALGSDDKKLDIPSKLIPKIKK